MIGHLVLSSPRRLLSRYSVVPRPRAQDATPYRERFNVRGESHHVGASSVGAHGTDTNSASTGLSTTVHESAVNHRERRRFNLLQLRSRDSHSRLANQEPAR